MAYFRALLKIADYNRITNRVPKDATFCIIVDFSQRSGRKYPYLVPFGSILTSEGSTSVTAGGAPLVLYPAIVDGSRTSKLDFGPLGGTGGGS